MIEKVPKDTFFIFLIYCNIFLLSLLLYIDVQIFTQFYEPKMRICYEIIMK